MCFGVRQDTDYPNSGRVQLTITPEEPTTFTLRLRIPTWTTNATVSINGQPARATTKAGSFCALHREWKPGDKVALNLPMPSPR